MTDTEKSSRTVMAQGTFDLLHPGHVHYLEMSAELGDELVVVVARDSRAEDRKQLIFDEEERRQLLEALEAVDTALLGSEGDIYSTVREVNPDIITLGEDQHHNPEEVRELAEDATGHEVEVETVSSLKDYSSSSFKQKFREK